jgi:hypothetical protein
MPVRPPLKKVPAQTRADLGPPSSASSAAAPCIPPARRRVRLAAAASRARIQPRGERAEPRPVLGQREREAAAPALQRYGCYCSSEGSLNFRRFEASKASRILYPVGCR